MKPFQKLAKLKSGEIMVVWSDNIDEQTLCLHDINDDFDSEAGTLKTVDYKDVVARSTNIAELMQEGSDIEWFSIDKYGMPPLELQERLIGENTVERDFLVKGEYSIFCASVFGDGSGFNVPDGIMDDPKEWAIIKGF